MTKFVAIKSTRLEPKGTLACCNHWWYVFFKEHRLNDAAFHTIQACIYCGQEFKLVDNDGDFVWLLLQD